MVVYEHQNDGAMVHRIQDGESYKKLSYLIQIARNRQRSFSTTLTDLHGYSSTARHFGRDFLRFSAEDQKISADITQSLVYSCSALEQCR